MDLDVSPSQTISRARTSLRRPSSSALAASTVTKVEVTTSTSTTEATTEKLTVGDILAGLHGDVQQDTKTATLRPHAFRPKNDHNKLREKLRIQLEDDNSDHEFENFVKSEDQTSDTDDVTEIEENTNSKVLLPVVSRPASSLLPRRGVIPASRSKFQQVQQTLPKLRTRKPISRTSSEPISNIQLRNNCLLYTSQSPRDQRG